MSKKHPNRRYSIVWADSITKERMSENNRTDRQVRARIRILCGDSTPSRVLTPGTPPVEYIINNGKEVAAVTRTR